MGKKNIYTLIIEKIFTERYVEGSAGVPFNRSDILDAAKRLDIAVPKNLGDIVYSFRYRANLPKAITEKASLGKEWIIRPAGQAQYKFVLIPKAPIVPSDMMAETKIMDATPGVITRYALSDEQALLAKLRYNRLVDTFTRLTCYSLQSHLRTTVPGMGQIETDEIYIGVDTRGAHYVLPVQAKGGRDRLGIVQIEQDIALCEAKFPILICRPIAAQFMTDNVIALFELAECSNGIGKVSEQHYRLVPPEDLSDEELKAYGKRPLGAG